MAGGGLPHMVVSSNATVSEMATLSCGARHTLALSTSGDASHTVAMWSMHMGGCVQGCAGVPAGVRARDTRSVGEA